ncbi:MAG: TRAP transporter TatT component family protein, partial [Gammaproteobacteria bacterium]
AAMDDAISQIQSHWATANYASTGRERDRAFESLVEEADRLAAARPEDAATHVWAGIVHSTYAGEVNMFSAGKHVKRARAELERALALDPDAMNGSAYTSLGALLYQIPGFMGGDEDEAERLLLKGLELNPDGIDPNYFYGSFLLDQERLDEAERYLRKAAAAAPRPGRELADQGRQEEIASALAEVAKAR